jgi:flagellar hook assembly protein FlgD
MKMPLPLMGCFAVGILCIVSSPHTTCSQNADARGDLVMTLVDKEVPEGIHSVAWEGKDDDGAPVASGVYFCRFACDGVEQSNKLVLVK